MTPLKLYYYFALILVWSYVPCFSYSVPVSSSEEVKVFSILDGKIKNCHNQFFDILGKEIANLKEGRSVDESDIILVFCPIVSRGGFDIEEALKKFIYPTGCCIIIVTLFWIR